MSPYAEFSVTPAPAGPERSIWDDLEWADGPTLLGFSYGPAPAATGVDGGVQPDERGGV